MSRKLTIAYSDSYLDWKLGAFHPTNPIRAKIATEWLDGPGTDIVSPVLDTDRLVKLLSEVHDRSYIDAVLAGRSDEWSGARPDLGRTAALMAQGTVDLVDQMLVDREADERTGVYFNPQGAKHHAMRDRSGGFCVFNDMAVAGKTLLDQGLSVVYVDWDAHHGDGVEELLRDTDAWTFSIHDGSIFPGTGLENDAENRAYNWPLEPGAGDAELLDAVHEVCGLVDNVEPDVIMMAIGADGLEEDPLSTTRYSIKGYADAAKEVRSLADRHGSTLLVGGAGGYTPWTSTPLTWATVVRELAD